MRKFEIISNKWIKCDQKSLKIDEIKSIAGEHQQASYSFPEEEYRIRLEVSSGLSIILYYTKNEETAYKNDLQFLEDLLYNL